MGNFIKKQLLRVNGLQLIIAVVVLIVLNGNDFGFIGFSKKMYTGIGLEQLTTIDQLQTEFEREPKDPVMIKTDKYLVTEWAIFKKDKPQAVYVLFPLEDKLVAALVPINYLKRNSENKELVLKGVVRHLTEWRNIIDSFDDEDVDKNELSKRLVPYLINCYGDLGFNSHPLSALIISILPMGYILWKVLNLLLPGTSKLALKLSKYGDLETIGQSIDEELEQKIKLKIASVTITESWFIAKVFLGINVVPLNHVVWVHKQTTQHYQNYIPTGKSYQICLYTDRGETYMITLPDENSVDQLIVYFVQNLPWIICGYNEELKDLWSSNRSGFITEINNRKDSFLSN
ncbi:MAG TPA: hypothetical protein PLZ08_04840 [Bacillota bacterium]|jgi:hypothetical protein|nr:hypothetical protein [Bacillota bacterium]HPO97269.1 hypothetical protein [Bacillota bacterium]